MKKPDNSFEAQWRKQFMDQEVVPAEKVWDRVGAGIANQQVNKYKRRLLFYKFVAAASVVFALVIGSFSLYNWYDSPDENLVALESIDLLNNSSNSNEGEMEKRSINDSDEVLPMEEGQNDSETSGNLASLGSSVRTIMVSDENNGNEYSASQMTGQSEVSNNGWESDGVQFLSSNQFKYPYVFPLEEEQPGRKSNPYLMPTILSFAEVDEEKDSDNKVIWAGVNFSSGMFDPNISYNGSNSPVALADALNDPSSVISINAASYDLQDQSNNLLSYKPEESSYEPEMSYSYGLNFGFQFSKRFVLLSGLSYLYNNSSTTVNTYVEPANTNAKYANHAILIERASPGIDAYNSLSSDIQLNSTYEFVTVPVNMGYNIINRKMKWMMLAGVSADFLIKNTIYDSNEFFDSIEYTSGGDSPYNSTYFNAVFGTMLNYTFSRHYLISVEPSYRLGISDLTNSNAVFTSRPSSFLITAGISFVF